MIRYAYLFSLIPTLLAIAGNTLGSWWTLAAMGCFAVLVIPDWFWKNDCPLHDENKIPEITLWLQALLQTVATGELLVGIGSQVVSGWFVLAAAYSTGLTLGVGGLTVAHEFIHRHAAPYRCVGIWLCFLNRYSHYYIEHLESHHRHVASQDDPVTAGYGESFYHYIARLGWQQFEIALKIEAARLRRKGQAPYGFGNFVVTSTLLECAILILIVATAGWFAATAFVFAGMTARFFLESATYVQHYGMSRVRLEAIEEIHSWECNSLISRVMFLELPRHADHHCHGSRPYAELVTRQRSPKLPAGHFGLFPVVLVPSLWFSLANPRLSQQFKAPT